MRSGPIIVAPLVERSKSSFSVSREMSTLNFLHFNPTIKLSGWGIKNLDKSASFGFGKTFKLFANEELPRRPLGMKDMTPCHWSNFPPRFTIDFLTLLPLSLSTSPYWIFCHLTLFLVIDNKLIFLLLFLQSLTPLSYFLFGFCWIFFWDKFEHFIDHFSAISPSFTLSYLSFNLLCFAWFYSTRSMSDHNCSLQTITTKGHWYSFSSICPMGLLLAPIGALEVAPLLLFFFT